MILVAGLGVAAMAWWLWPSADAERPDVYAVTGPQPGDLNPGLDLTDNVRNYGIDLDIEYHFRTNSLGFRGPEPTGREPVVLVLGDSFAFGMGVSEGETFPDVLREQLRRQWPEVVVHNAAVPGYTITDQDEQFGDRLHRLKPDLVVLCHTASDLKEMARPTSFRRLMAWDDEDPALADPEVAAVVARYGGEKAAATRAEYVFTQEQLLQRLGASAPVELNRWRDEYTEQVLGLKGRIEALGGQLAVVMWVDGYGMAGLDANPVVTRLRAASVQVFEGSKAMMRQPDVQPDQLFLPDGHLSVAGNRVAGVQTADWLLKSLPSM